MARHSLSAQEMENAKIFFHGLKQLSEGDLKLLSDTYYKSDQFRNMDQRSGYYLSVKPYSDEMMTEKYHVSLTTFRRLRNKAQDNLKAAMQEILTKIQTNFVYRINRQLYLVDIVNRGTSKEQYTLGREQEAKEFNGSDSENEDRHLMSLGFERVPMNET
ncbi:hypothetical protein SAMN04487821_14316 [Enterococcus malodoratus]|uniref:hypothetical protein n=1 Tax=Enterococcus malodoratus TaxID=71451 RepID=UPI0008D28ADD|nr:hypothetical protein [Enterococcus malodoratus]SEU00047.1 hypothetical protein SAMN04487821_14316 [Enterococcus malodoratus]